MKQPNDEYGEPISLSCEQGLHESCVWILCKCPCHQQKLEQQIKYSKECYETTSRNG